MGIRNKSVVLFGVYPYFSITWNMSSTPSIGTLCKTIPNYKSKMYRKKSCAYFLNMSCILFAAIKKFLSIFMGYIAICLSFIADLVLLLHSFLISVKEKIHTSSVFIIAMKPPLHYRKLFTG